MRDQHIVIIAEDVDEALTALVVNKLRGGIKIMPSRRQGSETTERPICKIWPY